MPELPEVETVVRALEPVLRRQQIVGVRVGRHRLRRSWQADWKWPTKGSCRVVAVRRRGKWIIVELSQAECLLVHLGMTGRLQVVPRDQPEESHTHLVFQLAPGRKELRFRDPRRFGSVGLVPASDLTGFFERQRLGPEPFEVTPGKLFAGLRQTRRCLKAALLDQRLVAGIGNIYADEALFEARLHPAKLGCQVTRAEAGRLRRALVKVLRRAINQKGSSIRDYFYENGRQGNYQNEFRVYAQSGSPCPRCRTPIACIRLTGRSTPFCPKCQPEVRGQKSETRNQKSAIRRRKPGKEATRRRRRTRARSSDP